LKGLSERTDFAWLARFPTVDRLVAVLNARAVTICR
jgi:hypothetical protein